MRRGVPRMGRSIHARWAPALVAALVMAGVPPVQARGRPSPAEVRRAEELYDNGRKLYGEGSYDAAALAFAQAYELSGNTDMLYNAALAYDRADAFEQAISALDRYRALAPADEREALDERKHSLRIRLDKQRARERAAAPSSDATRTADEPGNDAPYPSGTPRERPKLFGPTAWALTGTAIAAFAFGTGFGAASLVRTRAGRKHCTGDDPPLCDTGARTDAGRSRSYAIVADVAFAVGGALTIALITVLAVKASRRKHVRGATATPFEPRSGGVLVRF